MEQAEKAAGTSYLRLLRIPHTARYTFGTIFASMPFPMITMTVTISVHAAYGNYTLAGALAAVQAISFAIMGPLLGKLVDAFGQRTISLPAVAIWCLAAALMITCITLRVPPWILFVITPFMGFVPPWAAMSRARWTYLLRHNSASVPTALSLCAIFDDTLWIIGTPLASILAIHSGILAFSFTEICVIFGAILFLGERTTEPPILLKTSTLQQLDHDHQQISSATEHHREQTSIDSGSAAAPARNQSLVNPGMLAICASWLGIGAFQTASYLSIVAFGKEQNATTLTGLVFSVFSISSMLAALFYGSRHWKTPLWKRFYVGFLLLTAGTACLALAPNLWVMLVINCAIGIFQSPTWINGNQIMFLMAPQGRFTESLTWMNSFNSVGGSLGSMAAGVAIDASNATGGLFCSSAIAIAAIGISLIGLRHIRKVAQE